VRLQNVEYVHAHRNRRDVVEMRENNKKFQINTEATYQYFAGT
jgi:hypothetical protein